MVVQTTGVSDVLQSAMDEADGRSTSEESITESSQAVSETESSMKDSADPVEVDIDLTVLSANTVYATVFDMLFEPEIYVGKVVKMEGMFTFFYDEACERYLFACIISDATACCSQGIEFIPTDEYNYPDGFPKGGENITVTGVFEILTEDGVDYIALTDAEIIFP